MAHKKKLAVFKFASCDGCQLSLLSCEDDFLPLAETLEIAHFLEASGRVQPGPYDITLVEGSITTPADAECIREVRRVSKKLVTIGACATTGGIQALRNFADVKEYASVVYAHPEYVKTLATSSAIAEHVPVDHELFGCPVSKEQLLGLVGALAAEREPPATSHSVCIDCKLRGNTCVLVSHGTACLGPVTRGGCGALCPSFTRGCYGCFGPAEVANTRSLLTAFGSVPSVELERLLGTFNVNAGEFRAARERLVTLRVPGKDEPR